jgi:hypothetical protein
MPNKQLYTDIHPLHTPLSDHITVSQQRRKIKESGDNKKCERKR